MLFRLERDESRFTYKLVDGGKEEFTPRSNCR